MPYTVFLQTQISETSVLENLKLFLPGHVIINQSRPASFHLEIYAPHWSQDYAPNWDILMVPSDLEFSYADLQGDVFQVPMDWTIVQLLEEYRPEWRIRQYNYIKSTWLAPGTSQPFVLRLQCHKVRQGVILPWHYTLTRLRKKTIWFLHHLDSLWVKTCFVGYSLLSFYDLAYVFTSFIYGFSIDPVWPLLFTQLLVFSLP